LFVLFVCLDSNPWWGVDVETEGICNTMDSFVWEPTLVKLNAIAAATEACCMILSVDETIRHPKSEGLNDDRMAPAPRR
jgi:T-complex protein 1 subunit eta